MNFFEKIFFIALIAFILFFAGCNSPPQAQVTLPNSEQTVNPPQPVQQQNNDSQALPDQDPIVGNFTIEITENGYSPAQLTIKKGNTITWINKSNTPNWPASARHPTHTVYPGSSIEKCNTGEQEGIFDACKGLEKNETFSFTFNEVGEWDYHEHLMAKQFGKIIVVE